MIRRQADISAEFGDQLLLGIAVIGISPAALAKPDLQGIAGCSPCFPERSCRGKEAGTASSGRFEL
jgi:hypothetical protein